MERVVLKDVYFSYEDGFELRGISLKVHAGEVCAILGPNGSGKTTLLRCIYKLLRPFKGCIYVDGRDVLSLKTRELARLVGGVPQEHHPVFPYRAIDMVVMGRTPYLSLFSAPSHKDYEDAYELMKRLGIAHLAERPYTQLSGGERKLVLIARALMQNPRVLLLDEPTSHLDIKNKILVLRAVRRLCKDRKVAVLMTTHDPNEAMAYSDKIVLMNKGEVVFIGGPEDLSSELLSKVYDVPLKV
ncbi:MAG: ABC transporter ATP-binding protein, partial [Thermoprotei archaeon]